MSNIFKINLLKNNKVTDVFIFNGEGESTATSKSKSPNGHNINAFIHTDDSIMRIKEKIIKHCLKDVSTKEIYLYAITKKQIVHNIVYSELTQNNSIDLTKKNFSQFIKNIVGAHFDVEDFKESTTNRGENANEDANEDANEVKLSYIKYINAINKIAKDGEYVNQLISLGQKIVINKRYPFCVNPYDNEFIDDKINISANIISTENKRLLFDCGSIDNNEIYVCLADDVLKNKSTNLTEKYLIKLYYPTLYSNSIVDITSLDEKRAELLDDEEYRLQYDFENYNNIIDLYYRLFYKNINSKTNEELKKKMNKYDIINFGISSIKFTQYPYAKIKIPLEILFKMIHSTKKIQMIKYNPGVKKENIYRLFTGDKNVNIHGDKIPLITTMRIGNTKEKILRIINTLAINKSIGMYYENDNLELFYNVYENGNIELNINVKNNELFDIGKMEATIRRLNNSVFKEFFNTLKRMFNKLTYNFSNFHSFKKKQDRIEINNIDYALYVKGDEIKFHEKMKYFTTLLRTSGDKTKNKYIYWRVSDFQEMNFIDKYIGQKYKEGLSVSNIVNKLIEESVIRNRDKAMEKVSSWLSKYELKEQIYVNKNRNINTNSGLDVSIEYNSLTDIIEEIEVVRNVNMIKITNIFLQY